MGYDHLIQSYRTPYFSAYMYFAFSPLAIVAGDDG
jgi:hypothetical protein